MCRIYRGEVKSSLCRQTKSAVKIDRHVTKNFATWLRRYVSLIPFLF